MAETLRETAPAKINLTLRVVSRRADGYHELESLVAFADLADVVTLEPDAPLALEVGGPFAAAAGPDADNLVLKAARLMGLGRGRFTLEKNVPVAAGLGGGSSDAAATLRLIARLRGIDIGDPTVRDAARRCGADVPVCLAPQARIMRGIGDVLSAPVALPPLPILLVNPGVGVATRDVFALLGTGDRSDAPLGDAPGERSAFATWLKGYGNDLTRAAVSRAPVVGEVLSALAAVSGCELARMSGSGATCFGMFASADGASHAASLLRPLHRDWWMTTAVLS